MDKTEKELKQFCHLTTICKFDTSFIYIYKALCQSVSLSVCLSPFVCPRGTNISYTQERGGTNISHTQEEGGDQTFYVGGGGAYYNVDEKMGVSEANFLVSKANILVSEASKLSAGARIFRGP